MRAFIGYVAIAGLASFAVRATDLNAPLSQQPTLGSEIHRGISAGRRCNFTNDNNFHPLGLVKCVTDIDARNTETNPSYKPFSLGIHFEAWFWEDLHVSTQAAAKDKYSRDIGTLAGKFAPLDFEIARQLQHDLGVSDDQLIQVAEIPPGGVRQMKDRLAYWDRLAKAKTGKH